MGSEERAPITKIARESMRVLPLPVTWAREGETYVAEVGVPGPSGYVTDGYKLHAEIKYDSSLIAWLAYVSINAQLVYHSEHRERDEAAGACVVAMQRALDVRHP